MADRKASMTQRRKALAETATPTRTGVKLDLRIYLYPEGHGGIGTPRGETDVGTMVDDDLELIVEFAQTVRLVRRALARGQRSV